MQKNDPPYDKKTLLRGLIGLGIMMGIMKATGGAGFALIIPLILIAFARNRIDSLVYLLMMTTVLSVTNSFFAPKDMIFSICARGAYLLIASIMILQNVTRRKSKLITPLLSLIFYVGFQALTSAFGWQPLVSYLKLFLFFMVFLAFYSVANATSERDNIRLPALRSCLLVFASFIILGSVALIPFPAIAKMGATAAIDAGLDMDSIGLFMGVTFQPQTLGPAVAVISVVLFADLLFSIRRCDCFYLLLLLAAPVLVYYTSSRTAMGTYVAGMLFALWCFIQARSVGSVWKTRVLGIFLLLGIMGTLITFATPQLRQKATEFVFKTHGGEIAKEEQKFDRLVSSRQGLVDDMMVNFRKSPIIGNGFQVSAQMQGIRIFSWKQLLSAPIEKGVFIPAVLEEGGVVGMILFCIFLVVSFYSFLTRHAYIGACALFVFLVANLGEFSLFSMSSIGGLMWAIVFIGLGIDAHRVQQQTAIRVNLRRS
ncbi:MAG: O-antigen ligase family protein [Kiritimatiellia bacterium]